MSLDEISLDLEWVLILMTSVLIREGRGELETRREAKGRDWSDASTSRGHRRLEAIPEIGKGRKRSP